MPEPAGFPFLGTRTERARAQQLAVERDHRAGGPGATRVEVSYVGSRGLDIGLTSTRFPPGTPTATASRIGSTTCAVRRFACGGRAPPLRRLRGHRDPGPRKADARSITGWRPRSAAASFAFAVPGFIHVLSAHRQHHPGWRGLRRSGWPPLRKTRPSTAASRRTRASISSTPAWCCSSPASRADRPSHGTFSATGRSERSWWPPRARRSRSSLASCPVSARSQVPGSSSINVPIAWPVNPVARARGPKEQWLNPRAFTLNGFELGTLGNAGRGICEGPGTFPGRPGALQERSQLGRRLRAQLRFEVFNAFNHDHFLGVDTTMDPARHHARRAPHENATKIIGTISFPSPSGR